MAIDYEKLIVELIGHFGQVEGTDYLGEKGEAVNRYDFPGSSDEERAKLTELRDTARAKIGWHGYP